MENYSREVTVNIFDHLKNPSQDIPARSILQCLKILPFVADSLCNHLIDCLDNEKLFRNKIKHDLNRVRRLIEQLTIDETRKDDQSSGIFACDWSEKIEAMIIEYATMLVKVNETGTVESYLENVAENAVFLYKAKKGDTFTFLDQGAEFCEFTYVGITKVEGPDEFGILYEKHNLARVSDRNPAPVQFVEMNIYRPILITTPPTLREKLDNNGY